MSNQDLSRYTNLDRLCGGHLSHIEVANKVRMLMRNDLDHEAVCTMARDRIMHLAGEVERLKAKLTATLERHSDSLGERKRIERLLEASDFEPKENQP